MRVLNLIAAINQKTTDAESAAVLFILLRSSIIITIHCSCTSNKLLPSERCVLFEIVVNIAYLYVFHAKEGCVTTIWHLSRCVSFTCI